MGLFSRIKFAYSIVKSEKELANFAENLSKYHNCRATLRIGKAIIDGDTIDFNVENEIGDDTFLSCGNAKDGTLGIGKFFNFSLYNPGENRSYSSTSFDISSLSLVKIYESEEDNKILFTIDMEDDNLDYQFVIDPSEDYVMW